MNDFFNILFGNNTDKQEDVGSTELIGAHSLQLKDRTQKARQTMVSQRDGSRPQPPYPATPERPAPRAPYELDIDPEFQVPERPANATANASTYGSANASAHATAAPATPPAEATATEDLPKSNHNNNLYVEEMSQPMKAYDAKEVMEAATRYFDGEEMVANVWMNKYALRDGEGHIYERTPDDMHLRLAKEFARIEKNYQTALG